MTDGDTSRDREPTAKDVLAALTSLDVPFTADSVEALSRHVSLAIQTKRLLRGYVADLSRMRADDILRLVIAARDEGDLDEAVWRTFLATHFGRLSANGKDAESATRFLNGFGARPRWTWRAVTEDTAGFESWLFDNSDNLATLSLGNHRKREAKDAQRLDGIVESFKSTVTRRGGRPSVLLATNASDPAKRFHAVYERVHEIRRFGRLAAFDFGCAVRDLGLADVEPGSTYLVGSTGPKYGASRIWPSLGVRDLEDCANTLAERLGVSFDVMEDALCNFDKELKRKRDGGQRPVQIKGATRRGR